MKFIFSWEKGFHSFAALTCGIFFPLEDKLHMFAPPCNILYLLNWLNPDKEKELESQEEPLSGLAKSRFLFHRVVTNSLFLFFLEIKKYFFCPIENFQGPWPKFKDFPGPGNFCH